MLGELRKMRSAVEKRRTFIEEQLSVATAKVHSDDVDAAAAMSLDFDDVGLLGGDDAMFAFDALDGDVLLGDGLMDDLVDGLPRSRSHSLADSARLLRSTSFAASVNSETMMNHLHPQGDHPLLQQQQQQPPAQPTMPTPSTSKQKQKQANNTKTPAGSNKNKKPPLSSPSQGSQDSAESPLSPPPNVPATTVGGRKKRITTTGKGTTGKGKKSAKKATTKKHKVSIRLRFSLGGQVVYRGTATVQSDAIILTTLSPAQQTKTTARKARGSTTSPTPPVTTPTVQQVVVATTGKQQTNRKKIVTTPPQQQSQPQPQTQQRQAKKMQLEPPHEPREHESDGPLVRTNDDGASTELLWRWLNEQRFQDADPARLYQYAGARDVGTDDDILGTPLLSSLLVADDDDDDDDSESDDDDFDDDLMDDADDGAGTTQDSQYPAYHTMNKGGKTPSSAAAAMRQRLQQGVHPQQQQQQQQPPPGGQMPPNHLNNHHPPGGGPQQPGMPPPQQQQQQPQQQHHLNMNQQYRQHPLHMQQPQQVLANHVGTNGAVQVTNRGRQPANRQYTLQQQQQHQHQQQMASEERRSSLTRRLVAALLPPADVLTARIDAEPPPPLSFPPHGETPNDEIYDRCLADACADAGLVAKADDVLDAWRTKRRDSPLYVKTRRLAAKLRRCQRRNALLALPLAADVILDKRRSDAKRRNHTVLEARWKRLLKKEAELAKRKKAEAKAQRKANSLLPW